MKTSMKILFFISICFTSHTVLSANVCPNQTRETHYWANRERVLSQERKIALGGNLQLSEIENKANVVLMRYKEQEWQSGFRNPESFPPLSNFRKYPLDTKSSKVFKILRVMPKGALLHMHSTAICTFDLLMNLTYKDNLYVCMDTDKEFKIKFFREPDNRCNWTSIQQKREEDADFDSFLEEKFTILTKGTEQYGDLNEIWQRFEQIFSTVGGFLKYRPVFEEYLYESFLELYKDNVKYFEIRAGMSTLYDLNGNKYDYFELLRVTQDVIKRMQSEHPDFHGAKLIYSQYRAVTKDTFQEYIENYFKVKELFGDLIAGFDLVGQEKHKPLKDFIAQLLRVKGKMPFFFHAGETNWYGSDVDENIVDAILLGSKRIGHAFAITKHPKFLRMVKKQNIVLEVSPLSNIVLGLVNDARNHPAAVYGALGINFVIANDDPYLWKAKGVSHDWYVMFMGVASRQDDLRYLKKLALNSIEFSSLNTDEKKSLYEAWEKDWNLFIEQLADDQI